MNKPILQDDKETVKARQLAMAKNIGKLSNTAAQKRQARLLCRSLIQMMRGGRNA